MRSTLVGCVLTVIILLPCEAAWGERREWVIGGGGKAWREGVEQWIGLDDTTVVGAIQPKELHPWENVLRSPVAKKDEYKSIFGFDWLIWKEEWKLKLYGMELGWNPRMWRGGRVFDPSLGYDAGSSRDGLPALIDGDESAAVYDVLTYVPYLELYQMSRAVRVAYGWLYGEFWTMDLGIAVPINRIRFFPPQEGVDSRGELYKKDAPVAYEVSVTSKVHNWLLFDEEGGPARSLDHVVERTFNNTKSIIDVHFPTEPVRFIRLRFNLMPQTYTLAEIQAYGEGFPPNTRYIGQVIDFEHPVSFGRVFWKFTKFRRTSEGERVEDPDAPVRLILQTKSGSDDSPTAYHIIANTLKEKEVTKEEYDSVRGAGAGGPSGRLGLPGTQGSVTEDEENWDAWTSPYRTSGEAIRSSDARRYFQFTFEIQSEDVFASGRLDSLAFEYSPLLAKEIVGEISLADEPHPFGGMVEVPAGVDTTFAYDIKAEFDSPEQRGFDGIRMHLPSRGEFVRMEMGTPLVEVEPDSVEEGSDHLLLYFPSHRVTREENKLIRVVCRTAILRSGTYFTGEVFNTESTDLPQSIDPGDASKEVSTNSLRVFPSRGSLKVLSLVGISPKVITPNGDKANDKAVIAFTVLGVGEAQVSVGMYDLYGRRIREVFSGQREAGRHVEVWDGKDNDGQVVLPGVYLCKVRVDTEAGASEQIQVFSVVY